MPLYEVVCPSCGAHEIFAKEATGLEEGPCPECGILSPRNWQACGAKYEFKTYWTHGIATGADPVRIDSREQERRLCKELGCERLK